MAILESSSAAEAVFVIEEVAPAVTIRIGGVLDRGCMGSFEAAVTTVVDGGATSLCIDLGAVSDLDPGFVPALLRARAKVSEMWCENASARVESVLNATGSALVLGIRRS
jgi:hypothetical protein